MKQEYIEPYRDESGSVGLMIVEADGNIGHYSGDEWARRYMEDQGVMKRLRVFTESASALWPLPSRPRPSEFYQEWEQKIKSANLVEDADKLAFRKEWMEDILNGIYARLVRFFGRYLYFEDNRIYGYLANLTISTYFRGQFSVAPLTIFNGVRGSGKTTVLSVLRLVCYRAHLPTTYTAAACVDLVNDFDVTLLLDESLNNLRSDRGADLYSFLLGAYNKTAAMKIRRNANNTATDVLKFFTTVVMTTRGGIPPDDLRSRGFSYNMSLPGDDYGLEDLEDLEYAKFSPGEDPKSIRTDLYALALLTISEERKESRENYFYGMRFESYRGEVKKYLRTKMPDGRYFYGHSYDMKNTPKIANRSLDLANVQLTIGMATLSDPDMMRLIIDNDEDINRSGAESDESVLFMAFSDLIIKGYAEEYPLGQSSIIEEELRAVCSKISVKMVRDGYAALRMDYDGWKEKDVGDPRTITAKFRTLNIPYREGAGRINYIDGSHKDFLQAFVKAANNYCPPESKKFYKRILGGEHRPRISQQG